MESQVTKVETDVHIKASAEQFHDVIRSRPHHIAGVFPEKAQGVEIHEDEWGSEGSVIFYNYVHEICFTYRFLEEIDGKKSVVKELIESIDKENNKITFKVLEGDLLEHCKSFRFIIQVIPREKGSVAHWIMEYEKLKDHIPDLHSLLQLAIDVSKDIDAHPTQDDQKK